MNICFLDFETTGPNPLVDKAIEIGAVLMNDYGEVIKKFSSFIKPEGNIYLTESAKCVHNISLETINNADSESCVITKFFEEFGTDYRFASWNINFDVTLMRNICHRNNLTSQFQKVHYRHIDVQSISYFINKIGLYNKELNSLNDLAEYFGVKRSKEHSALEDSIILAAIFNKIVFITKDSFCK